MFSECSYAVIVERPAARPAYNENGLAAEIVNELMGVLGENQSVIHAMDIGRFPRVRAHVAGELMRRGALRSEDGEIPTPLLFANRTERQPSRFVNPGIPSLNVLIRIAASVFRGSIPTRVVAALIHSPFAGTLQLPESWLIAMERLGAEMDREPPPRGGDGPSKDEEATSIGVLDGKEEQLDPRLLAALRDNIRTIRRDEDIRQTAPIPEEIINRMASGWSEVPYAHMQTSKPVSIPPDMLARLSDAGSVIDIGKNGEESKREGRF